MRKMRDLPEERVTFRKMVGDKSHLEAEVGKPLDLDAFTSTTSKS